jgi:hypothetical protein
MVRERRLWELGLPWLDLPRPGPREQHPLEQCLQEQCLQEQHPLDQDIQGQALLDQGLQGQDRQHIRTPLGTIQPDPQLALALLKLDIPE